MREMGQIAHISFPFPLQTPGQSDRAAVVFQVKLSRRRRLTLQREDSVRHLFNDDKRHEASFRSDATSRAVDIRLGMFQRPAEAEFLGIWVMLTGPRYDDRSRSASPTLSTRRAPWENVDKRTVPATLEVWALPRHGRHLRTAWMIKLWNPAEGKLHHDSRGAPGEPTLLETIDLGRRTLEKEVSTFVFHWASH